MRTVVRNSFARETVRAERIRVQVRAGQAVAPGSTCTECGSQRFNTSRDGSTSGAWLIRFWVDPDSGSDRPIADGKLFCSRGCCEDYIGRNLDETKG